MEFFTGTLDNFEDEVEIAESYENLRLFHVGRGESESLQTEIGTNIEQQWTRLNNVSLEWFSAECAIFGEKMVDARPNRPVGIVLFAWTKTPLQSWLSPKVRAECQTPKPNEPHYASGVHNAIIWPLRFFTFRGVLWDHGESVSELNNMDSSTFVCATAALVADWRSYFYQAYVPADVNGVAFPVGIVQLGPDSSEPLLENISPVRLFQSVLLDAEGFPSRALSDVFTAATYDLVDNGTAHRDWFTKQFKAKRVVAERLIASAKKLLYESEESNQLKFQIVESDFAALKVEFSSDFTVSGTAGFAYLESLDGDWTPASIISQTNREVRIEPMPPNATVLAYAPYTTQCLHLKCSIYDLEGFPLQPQVVTFVRAAASRSAAHLAVLLTTVLSVAVLK